MGSTVPFSQVVNVIPSVLAAGGNALDLNCVMLTQNSALPYGAPVQFASQKVVASYFGSTSTEAQLATNYFKGFDGSTALPGALYFMRYPETAIAAFLESASLASMTLTQLQALSGSLAVVVDGFTWSAASINLSSDSSFSAAAATIQTALAATTQTSAAFTGSISGATLTVTVVSAGAIQIGQELSGTGVAAGTVVTALGTGTGGTGTYTVNNSQTVASESLTAAFVAPTVTYSSTSSAFTIASAITGSASTIAYATGTLAASLYFTQATGATLSQGSATAVPGSFMDSLVGQFQNWATFMTVWEATLTEKEAFATWSNANAPRYLYVCQDSDATVLSTTSTTTFGDWLKTNQMIGTCPVWGPSTSTNNQYSAFICGFAASLNFTRLNGRATLDFKSQSGLASAVTTLSNYTAVTSHGYNVYTYFGSNNPANNQNWMTPGSMSGSWLWADTYLNQIWLNAQLQLSMVELLRAVGSIPYNAAGYALVRAAAADPINAAINFGAIRPGITLSASQISEIEYLLGFDASSTITKQGYYLQIVPATATTRAARQSPPITLLYQDGESIQQINMASIAIQ
jgi:hypothetical protein